MSELNRFNKLLILLDSKLSMQGNSMMVMMATHLAIIESGSVNLELALFSVIQITNNIICTIFMGGLWRS